MGKWEQFEQMRAKRAMRHHDNLTENAPGCRCGLKWQPQEYVQLVTLICNSKGAITIAELVEHFDRPAGGITGAIQRLGLIAKDTTFHLYHREVCAAWVSRKKLEKFPPEIPVILSQNGWLDDGKRLHSPAWWTRQSVLKPGKLNKFNRDLK